VKREAATSLIVSAILVTMTLNAIADAYFAGLSSGDLSAVPYDENVQLRAPLSAGGSEVPISGKAAVLEFFSGVFAAIRAADVLEYFTNEAENAICVRADVHLVTGKTLRVADIFRVNAEGLVSEQENHYDPRPAIG
jgi:hypothetical protein